MKYEISKEELELIHFRAGEIEESAFAIRHLGAAGSTINGNLIIRHLYEFWYVIDTTQIHSVIEFPADNIEQCGDEIKKLIHDESKKCMEGKVTSWQASSGFIGQSCFRSFNAD
jgi:hypothetical protein